MRLAWGGIEQQPGLLPPWVVWSLCFVLFGLLGFKPVFAAQDPVQAERFSSYLHQTAQSENLVGLAVAVVRSGEVELLQTYGVLEKGRQQKVTSNTVFRIASLSKAFAATAAGQLIEEGELSLDQLVTPYAPELRLKDKKQLAKVTLLNVLSHRLGLPPYAYDNLLEAGVTSHRILQELGKVDLICPVGTCYSYQNVAFNTVANVIQQVGGRDYSEVVRSRIFEPIGMTTASFGLEGLQSTGSWARPHKRKKDGPWQVVDVKEHYYRLPAAGGVNASILDMAEWLKAQMGYKPTVLSASLLESIHQPRVQTPAETRRASNLKGLEKTSYGLGWRIYKYKGENVVNHSGSVEGYSAQIAFLPGRDVGIVLLANGRDKAFWSILPAFLDIELSLPVSLAKSAQGRAESG